jgi:cell division protein ZapA
MTENTTISTTIEILNKTYPVRCQKGELQSLQQAAALLNQKMAEVQESGKVINLERIAIITALNIAHQLLQLGEQKTNREEMINQWLAQLQDKLDTTIINKAQQIEFIEVLES